VGLTNVVNVAAGSYHSLALKIDGRAVSWGFNGYGQTNVPSALTGVIDIDGGYRHSVALTTNTFVPVLQFSKTPGNTITLSWSWPGSGASYQLQATEDLNSRAWSTVATDTLTKSTSVELTKPQEFFRLIPAIIP